MEADLRGVSSPPKKETGEPGGRRAATSPAAGAGINNCGRWDGSGGWSGGRYAYLLVGFCFAGLEDLGGERQEGMLPVS
jgi:hypothetical protein